jgi:hypothetical protein
MDTGDRIFIGRALDQIAKVFNSTADEARAMAAEAIGRGELKMHARIIEDTHESRMAVVDPSAFTPEGWTSCLMRFAADFIDCRTWVSVRHRRRIAQPHWLFVSGESLSAFLDTRKSAHGSTKPPSDQRLTEFVVDHLLKTKTSGKTPTKTGLYGVALEGLPGATRGRLENEFERQDTPQRAPSQRSPVIRQKNRRKITTANLRLMTI